MSRSLKVGTHYIRPLHSTSREFEAMSPQNYSCSGTYDKVTALSHLWHRTGTVSWFDTRTTIQATSSCDTRCVALTDESETGGGKRKQMSVCVYELSKRRARPDCRKAHYSARERQHVTALRAGPMRSCHRAGTALGPELLATAEGSKVVPVLN
jgi:hypothetical protein